MQGHSPRQREILHLMGVDIWRLRGTESVAPALVGDQPGSYEAGEKSGQGGAGDWRFVITSPVQQGGILLVRHRTHRSTGPDSPAERLVSSIALALTSGSGAPGRVEAVAAEGQSPDSEASGGQADWVSIADRLVPRLTVVLGEVCGRWISAAGHRSGKVVVAEDPDTLLARPDRKAALWRAIVDSGALDG